ncbi:DsrE family protein [Salsipaludibacter albus]|uniref:DsrE family protein n=1 Tax=Salsipaludibacter albus TaxID=2849650 RepID=UPI001EE3BAB4|nr:DsrE family protein [Salsipaludibacter albus]MBY5161423.1 DsrE family protein [Salsipaludibacter albus]
MTTADTEPLLFVCTHHVDEPERATVPFIAAATASVSGHRAIVVCTIDGVHNGTAAHADVQAEGTPALADLVTTLVDNGGEIWLCSACTTVRGITGDDVIEGASIVGAATIVEALATGRAISLG